MCTDVYIYVQYICRYIRIRIYIDACMQSLGSSFIKHIYIRMYILFCKINVLKLL